MQSMLRQLGHALLPRRDGPGNGPRDGGPPRYTAPSPGPALGALPTFDESKTTGDEALVHVGSLLLEALRADTARWRVSRGEARDPRDRNRHEAKYPRRVVACLSCRSPGRCYPSTVARELLVKLTGVTAETPIVLLVAMDDGSDRSPVFDLNSVAIETVQTVVHPWRALDRGRQSTHVPVLTIRHSSAFQALARNAVVRTPRGPTSWERLQTTALSPAFP